MNKMGGKTLSNPVYTASAKFSAVCYIIRNTDMILLRLLFQINPTSYPSRDFFLTLSNRFRSLTSGVYTLRNNVTQEEYQVYCHMEEIPGCGVGGWTLVMKVDGNKVNSIPSAKLINRG